MSTETQHTPGPWGFECEGPKSVILRREHWRVGVNGGSGVALVFISEANARLIAAAPELLEALEQLAEHGAFPSDTYDKAKAAIKKARGQE